jgi:hypothetical protein
MASGIAIRQGRSWWVRILGDGQILPLGDVAMGDVGVLISVIGVTGLVSNDGHSLDTNHAFEGKVGLVANCTG